MTDENAEMCPRCGGNTVFKVFRAPNMKVGGKEARIPDFAIKEELREGYGVENVIPFMGGSLSDVYREIKMQGSLVSEKMRAEKEARASKYRKGNREFHERSRRMAEDRYHELRARKAQEAAKKRAMTIHD